MKKLLVVLLALTMVFALVACTQEAAPEETPVEETPVEEAPVATPENPVIRLSTTTSVNDSGLLPYLQPFFEEATGYQLEVTSAGTGAAIEKARTGDADCLLVHSKSQEEAFTAESAEMEIPEERVSFMYNYFVIVGPEADPAGVAACTDAASAFAAIAAGPYTFITRGDESGTNTKELKLWEAATIVPEGDWYVNIGSGMGDCLNKANELEAYTLSDKGTFLAHEDELSILLEQAEDMMNTYSMIAVSPSRFEDVNYDGAQAFISWMTSEDALALIAEYGLAEYGEALFYPL